MAQNNHKNLAHHVYELPDESEERLGNLFRQIDTNGDGRIDFQDLTEGLKRLNIAIKPEDAENMMRKADVSQSNDLTFGEFVHYLQEHEKQLQLVFSALDTNRDGTVDETELVSSFQRLGINISSSEANRLLRRVPEASDEGMDKDGTLKISFDEWRDYLMFHPAANLHDIIMHWRHATVCIPVVECTQKRKNNLIPNLWVLNTYRGSQPNTLGGACLQDASSFSILPMNLDVGEDLSVPDDFSVEEMVSGKWWRHLVAGGVAGMVSRTCTAPLDRLKVFLQVHGLQKFKGLGDCLRYMHREGGIKSFWRGNGINVLKIAPESALKFTAYEQAKKLLVSSRGNPDKEITIYERFAAGSFAGGFSQTAIYPLEVMKTRLALRKTGQYKGIKDAAVKICRQEGYRSFYRGYLPNLLGIIPYAGIDLAIYETLKNMYLNRYPKTETPSILAITGCGALSSSCGQIASYPLALVRTRLQAQVITPGVVQTMPVTMSGLFRHILTTEGLTGLYRGITPNFMKVAPAVSISYVVYEKGRQALGVSMT